MLIRSLRTGGLKPYHELANRRLRNFGQWDRIVVHIRLCVSAAKSHGNGKTEARILTDLIFEVGGELPYNQRLQVLDLLAWRVATRIADGPESFEEYGPVPDQLLREANGVVARARRFLTTSAQLEDQWGLGLARRPFAPSSRFTRYWTEALLNNERLALPGASLAIAAGGLQAFEINSIHANSPLKIGVTIAGAIGAVSTLAAVYEGDQSRRGADHLREVCNRIAVRYEASLHEQPGQVSRDQLQRLGEAFKECVRSPIFNAAPIDVHLPDGDK